MSLYKLIAEYADISIATVYRKISELITWGYLVRVNKNNYLITVKGLITLALLCMNGSIKDDEVCQDVVSLLKREWDLEEFNDENVKAYLKLLITKVSKDGLDPLQILPNLSFPRSVLLLFPNDIFHINNKSFMDLLIEDLDNEELVIKAQGIIAKALMALLPITTLEDGCKAVTISGKVIAVKCRIKGYTINPRCPILMKTTINK
ncbi:hypothetical protein [Vulcanisaeta sp. JCM 16161]|uniref:hypothetical protein n=1 Tax=Vulcanisaeta sp. JCM 16161 TaxID=1295372 RepID=UPI0006D0D903|nr:hypothetical protein [Vulcanisaeta sp. JCM 16161]